MKIFSFILPLVLAVNPLSCDSHAHLSVRSAPVEIKEAIEAQYPGARIVEVEREFNGYDVEIVYKFVRKDVYYSLDFQWIKTETDDVRFANLPQAVKDAIAASPYGQYRVDDIDLIESPQGDVYMIELERFEHEVKLRITPAGELL